VSAQVPSFSAGTQLVVLSATAVDRQGRPVRDLHASEFQVLDEGQPRKLEHFTTAEDLECRILLLVDASGSMNATQKSNDARMVATQLLATFAPKDRVALAGFDSRYFGVVPFTLDREAISKGFAELAPFGGTALHDALDQGAHDIASHGEGRRAIVVITDGIDNVSEKTPEQVIARSRALDVPIYAITVLSPIDDPDSPRYVGGQGVQGPREEGRARLERYAALSGGLAFTVSDFRGIAQAVARIAGELKHQYRLGYDPPSGGSPRFRRIEVKTTRKGVVVRARSGYVPGS